MFYNTYVHLKHVVYLFYPGFLVCLVGSLLSKEAVGAATCVDDPNFDCAHISLAFDICADVVHAQTVCPKFCNLCKKDPRDCQDALNFNASSLDGKDIYLVHIGQSQKNAIVQCDMSVDGGGWTVLMYRDSASVNFNRNSSDYALGFGRIGSNSWIGLESMHDLTSDGRKYELRVEMTMANGSFFYEMYDEFSVGISPNYMLHVGKGRGTAGDSFHSHSGFGFTTTDLDNDTNKGGNCAKYLGGGWWFHVCYDACLTCPYVTPGTHDCGAMAWNKLGYCIALKSARMLVRPRRSIT